MMKTSTCAKSSQYHISAEIENRYHDMIRKYYFVPRYGFQEDTRIRKTESLIHIVLNNMLFC